MKSRARRKPKRFSPTPTTPLELPALRQAEQELHSVAEQIAERISHHSDRPEIELRILKFLTHAFGPSTEGIATEMGISPEAIVVHLEALHEANRIWGQVLHGEQKSWHISQEGRHFLAQRGHSE